ncbi:MAG: tail fiber domain-containing protein [Prolixibacteraceae bacterium]|nr:tail fiber domain-containing protein [Prolixibacteraceae bacterium]
MKNQNSIKHIGMQLVAIIILTILIASQSMAQITINTNGQVRLADDLTVRRYNNVTLQVLPDANNTGYIGILGTQFLQIRGQYHYATLTLLQSDKRLKENIRDIENPLDKILKLEGKKYDYIPESSDTIGTEKEKAQKAKMKKDRLGFIAQEVKEIIPEAVVYEEDEDLYYLEYNAIIPVIVEAIKAQQTQIDQMSEEIEKLSQKSKEKSATIDDADQSDMQEASLQQNVPNPFSQTTRIGMYLPKEITNAMLYLYNMQGLQMQQFMVHERGYTVVTIEGKTLQPGIYIYSLVADGKEVDTKKMILTQ